MPATNCHSIRDALGDFFRDRAVVAEMPGLCLLTLPLRTPDGHLIDVFIEQPFENRYLVHDGGKTTAELYGQGLHITPSRDLALARLAMRCGLILSDGTARSLCPLDQLHETILAVAAFATAAMMDVVRHEPVQADESFSAWSTRA